MKVRRDILLFAAVAIAAVAAGSWLVIRRPGGAIETFQADLRDLQSARKARPPTAQTFRATICAAEPCVAVEAGGLTFLFGAGAGSADGLGRLGLIQSDLDGIVLPDLSAESVAGLPEIAVERAAAGRLEPLKVFAPSGAVSVVDGANLLASSTTAARINVSPEGEDQGISGRVIFDSGVVTIRGFGGAARGEGRTYRVDFDGKALILAGCLADTEDILAASRLAPVTALLVTARDSRLSPADGNSCLDLPEIAKAALQVKAPVGLVSYGGIGADLPSLAAAWREAVGRDGAAGLEAGITGRGVDISGAKPRLFGPN